MHVDDVREHQVRCTCAGGVKCMVAREGVSAHGTLYARARVRVKVSA